MYTKVVMTLLILLTFGHMNPASVFCQDIQTPWTWGIVSDFGPRLNPGWDFHEGIDYSAAPCDGDLGTPIPAVEGGAISRIEGTSLFQIRVNGTRGEWAYLHIFRTGDLVIDNWELRQGATLVNPSNPQDKVQGNVIILWSGTRAEKVLSISTYTNRFIQIGTNSDGSYIYLQSTDGNSILTRGSVVTSELIAPMSNWCQFRY